MGDKMRIDQQNNMKTLLVGTGHGNKARDRDNTSIFKQQERRHSDQKDYYTKYYRDLRTIFDLRDNIIHHCMDKVDKMITAKNNEKKLTGKREAYAAIILRLVAEEQGLPIKLTDIMNS